MKQTVVLCAVLFVFAAGANAQANSDTTLPLAPTAELAAPAASADATSPVAAETAASPAVDAFATALSNDPGSDSGAQEQPTVHGVFKNYNWQATAGYTFFRFYIVPHVTSNMNGLNLGLVYYPKGFWVGGDGEFPEWARIGRLGYVNRCLSARLRDVLRRPYKAPILIKRILCKMPEAKTEQSVLSQALLFRLLL